MSADLRNKIMYLELLKQDGDNKFSGSINFPQQGVVGRFEAVVPLDEFDTGENPKRWVEHVEYWIGDVEITESESPALTCELDRLAYELDYDGFALPELPTEADIIKHYHTIGILDELVDEKSNELARDICDKMGVSEDDDDYWMEVMSMVRGGYFDYYTKHKDDALKKAEAKIVELKRAHKTMVEEHNAKMIGIIWDYSMDADYYFRVRLMGMTHHY